MGVNDYGVMRAQEDREAIVKNDLQLTINAVLGSWVGFDSCCQNSHVQCYIRYRLGWNMPRGFPFKEKYVLFDTP